MVRTVPHNASDPAEVMTVTVPECDWPMDPECSGSKSLKIERCKYDTTTGTSTSNPRMMVNEQTAFVDASVVYGATEGRMLTLRLFRGGLLRDDPVNGCPRNTFGVPMAGPFGNSADQRVTGDDRGNVNPGLLALHCLFILEHNRLARSLAEDHPTWGDDDLFQEARKRVQAIMQSITYNEYAPLLLGAPLSPYTGYDENVDPSASLEFSLAAYRYGHVGINGQYWCIQADGTTCPSGHVLLRDAYFRPTFLEHATIGDFLRGLLIQPEANIDLHMVDDVRNFVTGVRADLAAMDIMRGRDAGLPSFTAARKLYGLSPVSSFDDLPFDSNTKKEMKKLYASVDDIDLWVGGLAEEPERGTSAFIGATFAAIVKDQFERSRAGDRFFYENSALTEEEGGLSSEFRLEAMRTKLSDVMARNLDMEGLPRSILHVPVKTAIVGPFETTNPYSPYTNPFTEQDFYTPVISYEGGDEPTDDGGSEDDGLDDDTMSTDDSNDDEGGGDDDDGEGGGDDDFTPVIERRIHSHALADDIELAWEHPMEGDEGCTFHITYPGTGWIGIGFGSGMIGADIFRLLSTPTEHVQSVQDLHAFAYQPPELDESQDVEFRGAVYHDDGSWTATVYRKFDTGDAPNDNTISKDDISTHMIAAWAYGSTDFSYHSTSRAQFSIEIAPGGFDPLPQPPASTDDGDDDSGSTDDNDDDNDDDGGSTTTDDPETTDDDVDGDDDTAAADDDDNGVGDDDDTPTTAPPAAPLEHNLEVASDYFLRWAPPAVGDSSITMTVAICNNCWAAFGFGSGMSDADVVMVQVSGGRPIVTDASAKGYMLPPPDGSQDWELVAIDDAAGSVEVMIRRELVTGDGSGDRALSSSDGKIPMIFAWSFSSSAVTAHGPNRLQAEINLFAEVTGNGTLPLLAAGGLDDYNAARLATYGFHAVSMFFVWGIMVPASVFSIKLCKHRPSHMAFHKGGMLMAATLTIPAAGAAIVASSGETVLAHAVIGSSIAVIMLLQVIGGFAVRNWLRSGKSPPPEFYWSKLLHRGFGWMLASSGMINCTLGSRLLFPDNDIPFYTVLGFFIFLTVIFVGGSFYNDFVDSHIHPSEATDGPAKLRRGALSNTTQSMTMSEVRKAIRGGCKWVILDSWVYDVTTFVKHHPGGAFLIENGIGSDISQFFYGQEAFSRQVGRHNHSRQALELLRSMCVGVIRDDSAEASKGNWADMVSDIDASMERWVVTKRDIVDKVPSSRPVVRLHLENPRATAQAAVDWSLRSLGRFVLVEASSSTCNGAIARLRKSSGSDGGSRGGRFGSDTTTTAQFMSSKKRMRSRRISAGTDNLVFRGRDSGDDGSGVSVGSLSGDDTILRSRSGSLSRHGGGEAMVRRPYTIVRKDGETGFDLYVRRYERGLMSCALHELSIGDSLSLCGPKGVGLQLDKDSSGVIVAVAMGTGACTYFDTITLLHAWTRYRSSRGIPERVPSWSRLQVSKLAKRGEDESAKTPWYHKHPTTPKKKLLRVGSVTTATVKKLASTTTVHRAEVAVKVLPTAASRKDGGSSDDVQADGDVEEGGGDGSGALYPSLAAAQVAIPAAAKGAAVPTLTSSTSASVRPELITHPEDDVTTPSSRHGLLDGELDMTSVDTGDDDTSGTSTGDDSAAYIRPSSRDGVGVGVKLVLLVCIDNEDSCVEFDWLNEMHETVPDFELHVNIRRRSDRTAAAALSHPVLSYENLTEGIVTDENLAGLLPPNDLLSVSVCGSANFVRTISGQYTRMGLPRALLAPV